MRGLLGGAGDGGRAAGGGGTRPVRVLVSESSGESLEDSSSSTDKLLASIGRAPRGGVSPGAVVPDEGVGDSLGESHGVTRTLLRSLGVSGGVSHTANLECEFEAAGSRGRPWLDGVIVGEMRYYSRSPSPIDFKLELSMEAPVMSREIIKPRRRLRASSTRSGGDGLDADDAVVCEEFDDLTDEGFGEFLDRPQCSRFEGWESTGVEATSMVQHAGFVVSDEEREADVGEGAPLTLTSLIVAAPRGPETYVVQSSESVQRASSSVEEVFASHRVAGWMSLRMTRIWRVGEIWR